MARTSAKEKLKKVNEEFASAKPSKVLKMALEDLKVVEKDKQYKVDFADSFHMPVAYSDKRKKAKCSVCFAGAVMANRLGVPSDKIVCPSDFTDERIMSRLYALDHIRSGSFAQGINEMLGGQSNNTPNIIDACYSATFKHLDGKPFPDYDVDPKGFKEIAEVLIEALDYWGV